jgi:2-polyprenyl-3-methyl-5-hydroxy-6-metoxy-1,4-benzoquinol methylase
MDTVDGRFIYSLFDGAVKPQLVNAALILDVFSPLQEKPLTADEVAERRQFHPQGVRMLLDYLVGLKVMEKQGDMYSLTPAASLFLVKGSPSYVGDYILTDSTALTGAVLAAVRGEKRIDYEDHYDQDAWLESYSESRLESSRLLWEKAGFWAKAGDGLNVLDIACGCAIKSFVLARQSPNVHITCLDRDKVLGVARDLARRWDLLQQVTFLPADLNTTDLGLSDYDLCLMGQVTHHLTENKNRDVFRRIHAALKPGGMLVLDVPMGTGQPDEFTSFLTLCLWAIFEGTAYTAGQYSDWLQDCSFRNIQLLSERWMTAKK